MKTVNEIFFSIQNSDAEKRLVSGVSDSGEPNGSGLLLDYETSKPLLQAWSAGIEKKTNGASKGILRVMHQLETVGKIVSLEFDDKKRIVLVTVHVSDDTTWNKIQEGEYTGFSWWWRTQGMPWKDDDATEAYGRPIYRYTGKPIELSIVDAACVPGSDFTLIQNADFPEEEAMSEEKETPAVPETPEVPAVHAPDAPDAVDVKNGMYSAGRLLSFIEDVKYIQKSIAAECAHEGHESDIPEELQAVLRMLAPIAIKYAEEQVDEAMDDDFDTFVSDDDEMADVSNAETGDGEELANLDEVLNGDYPGHPFRGNQYRGGKGGGKRGAGGKHHQASKLAHRASVAAASGKGDHKVAAKAHKSAAALHAAKGNKRMESYHKAQSSFHSKEAKMRTTAKSFQNADGSDIQNAESRAPLPSLRVVSYEQDNGIEVKNAEAPVVVDPIRQKAEQIASAGMKGATEYLRAMLPG